MPSKPHRLESILGFVDLVLGCNPQRRILDFVCQSSSRFEIGGLDTTVDALFLAPLDEIFGGKVCSRSLNEGATAKTTDAGIKLPNPLGVSCCDIAHQMFAMMEMQCQIVGEIVRRVNSRSDVKRIRRSFRVA